MAREEDVIWAAGFFDGEGCVRITRQEKYGKTYHWMDVSVFQAEQTSIELLMELFGGSISDHHSKRDIGWWWRAHGPTADAALREMLPYLRVKRRQAEIAINFQSRRLASRSGARRDANWTGDRDKADYAEVRRLKRVV